MQVGGSGATPRFVAEAGDQRRAILGGKDQLDRLI